MVLRQREDAETMAKLAELGWGKDDPAYRQFFTTVGDWTGVGS
jgi:hypothetical protein